MEHGNRVPGDRPAEAASSFAAFGFAGDAEHGWRREGAGVSTRFRLLRRLDELRDAERLQEEVFGVSERDLIPASELIVVSETGGAVIGAFLAESPDRAAGVIVGWGGFVGRPRIVSDFLAVRPEARNLGVAAELKRLQAIIALSRGFVEIVWTVDPLRAANARLNFGKLGAIGIGYEIDRYGPSFAAGLYRGMPSDRLHIRWDIADPKISSLLRTGASARAAPSGATREFVPGTTERRVYVSIPGDIDSLLAADFAAALMWRHKVREQLSNAFVEGFVIVGFETAAASLEARLILERQP